MDIFIIEGNIVKPTVHSLLIPEFKVLWDRDKSKDKARAIDEFTYIEFLCSVKKTNPFHGYSDEDRPKKIKEFIFKKRDVEISTELLLGIDRYNQLLYDASTSIKYYLAVKGSIHKMTKFYEELDLTERNEKGQFIHKISEVTLAITKANELLQNLNALKEKVEQELYESTRTKSNKEINPFEK